MHRRGAGRRLGLVLLPVLALATAGCANGSVAAIPPPPTTVAPLSTPTTVPGGPADLAPVNGATTSTTAVLAPGQASLQGTVMGPTGPVPGAVVRIQRVTPAGTAQADTVTAADGTWSFTGVMGGRYRVRSWRAPDLALTQPVSLFLAGTETRQVPMQLQQYTGDQVSSAIAPNPPVVGQPAELVVQVATTSVDAASGVVHATPVPGAIVQLNGSSQWQVATGNPANTDGSGQARWELTCLQAGSQPLQVVLSDGNSFPLDHVSPCVNPAPVTTTTSTTAPGSSSTTSTTGH